MGLAPQRHGPGTSIRGHPLKQVLDRVPGPTGRARPQPIPQAGSISTNGPRSGHSGKRTS